MTVVHSSQSTSVLRETSKTSNNPIISTSKTVPMTLSPQLVAKRARVNAEWKDLVYREALRMTGSLRQVSANKSSMNKKLIARFNGLLAELRQPNGLIGVDSDLHGLSTDFESLLSPWIELFQCEDLTGPFVHSGIISIRSFLHSGMFTDVNPPFSRNFMQDLVFSLAHSRFEPTNVDNDEIVMLELIEFLAELVQVTISATKNVNYSTNSISNDELIGETFLFQLFDLLFVLLNQNRFSELLRAKAIEIVVELCSLLFSSLNKISRNENERTSTIHFPNIVKPQKPTTPTLIQKSSTANSDSVVSINIKNFETLGQQESLEQSTASLKDEQGPSADYNPFNDEDENEMAPDAIEEVMKFRAKIAGISIESSQESESSEEALGEGDKVISTFDLFADRLSSHALKEILLFLVRCIDIIDTPGKKAPGSVKTESSTPAVSTKVIPSVRTQMAAMKCLIAIFTDPISELSKKKTLENVTVFERELIEIIGGDLLKQLLAILSLDTSSRHLNSLSQILLVLFTNYRSFLPAQFEYFISTCLGIISSKPAVGGNANNLVKSIQRPALTALKTSCLEMLSYFLQDPSFIAQIFVYYECSLDYQNTLELLTKGIAAGMEKSNGNEEIISLSGEILCNFIKNIEASLSKVHSKAEIEDLKGLLDQRRIKMIYSEAAGTFNSNPKEALPFLEQKGLLSPERTPKEIASFLRKAQGLDKKILGEYLVKPDHIEILREFFSAFKFSESTSIDSAIRQVLESFRLPGEAQQIDRIMECFSEIYYPSAKGTFSSQDACYVLAFSTLMLNTDLHNPQVKHKMTLTDFIRNNRGINDGKDVDEEYLTHLYNSIKTREIIMPEEHGGEEAFASQWNEVQRRVSNIKTLIEFDNVPLSPLVCGIVEIVWKPIILSLIPYINQQRPTGEVISNGPLEALRGIASLFEKFQMTEALDALLGNIWSVSNLIPVFSAASGNMIPRYLARLPGFRQVVQLIVDIFRGQGGGLKTSWTNWSRLLIILAESHLISVESVVTQESVVFDSKYDVVSLMALMKMAHEGRQIQPVGKQSFMSSISRFFGGNETAANAQGTANNVNPSNSNGTQDDITTAARLFVSKLTILEVLTSTIPWIKNQISFMACIESMCTHLKWNLAAGASTGKKMPPSSTIGLNWTEDTLILLTESIVTIGLAVEPERLLEKVLPLVFDTFTRLVLQDPCPPVKLCEHVVIGLGRLLLRLSETGRLSADKFVGYLKFWCQLSPQLQGFTLEPSLALIALTLNKNMSHKTKMSAEIWPPLFTILSTATKIDASAPYTLKLLQLICDVPQSEFPVDFFTEYIDLLSTIVIGCNTSNYGLGIFDPWRNSSKQITRGQIAEESILVYEKIFNKFNFESSESESSSIDTAYNWKNFIVPLEGNLSRHIPLHPIKSIRQQSMNLLTRLIPQTGKSSVPSAPVIFSKILIPLLIDLRLRQVDCDEIVMRCASLTCKTFLLHLNRLGGLSVGQLWKEILEALLPLILTGQPSEALKESVLESCKNVLLVMHSTRDTLSDDADVWRVSEVMLDPLIPGWKMEIEMRMSGHGLSEIEEFKATEQCEDINKVTESTESNEVKETKVDTVVSESDITQDIEPVTKTLESVTKTLESVTETLEPVIETLEPVTETLEPVTETLEPVIETLEPVIETNTVTEHIESTEAIEHHVVEPLIEPTVVQFSESPVLNDSFVSVEPSIISTSNFVSVNDDLMNSFTQTDTFISLDDIVTDNVNNNTANESKDKDKVNTFNSFNV